MKNYICTFCGLIGGAISSIYGGWDNALITLVIFMAIDYITGLIVAGVFNNSPKTSDGAIESNACFKGLCRKGMILLIVLVAVRIDLAMGTSFVRDAVIIGYIVNEAISIIENAGLMGIPVPKTLTKSISILRKQADSAETEKEEEKQ